MSLDEFKEGKFDSNSPINQEDIYDLTLTIEELMEQGETKEAIFQLQEVRIQIDRLRQVSKAAENTYFSKKLTEIYNIL